MDLKIDPEFRDLIPPLTAKEYSGLEESLLATGFDVTLPIIYWKGHEIIVDGHNRYGICKKHNITFAAVEHEFETRGDVLKWILDRQLDRRNLNNLKRTYLVGRRYLVEKGSWGSFERTKSPSGQNDHLGTSGKLADQLNIGEKTVRRAADFTLALDTIVSNTGIAVNDILDGKIPSNQQSIIALAELDKDSQKRVIDLILQDERDTVELAIKAVRIEKDDQIYKEAEEKRKQMEEQLKQEREAKEKQEREKLRLEREEKEKQEKERIEREKAEQIKRRLAEIERQKILAVENAKNAEERERIRKEKEEQAKIDKAKLDEDIKKLQEIKQKKLDEAMLEQKRIDAEILKKATLEREKADKEKIEKAVKEKTDEIQATFYDSYIKCAYTVMGEITLNACRTGESLYRIKAQLEYDELQTLNKNWVGNVWLDILDVRKGSKAYIEKLVLHYLDGGVPEAFVIARNDTDAEWFKLCAQKAKAIIFPLKGQLKSHALIYFGNNTETFMKECEKFGWGIILKN